MKRLIFLCFFGSTVLLNTPVHAQLSPGPLSQAHAHLEGMSNCTQCDTLGAKVSNEKCLACHTDLKSQIDRKSGYHSSKEISGKECISCHSDHHGLNFEVVRFNTETFNHDLTGYTLTGAHAKRTCTDCHKPEFIASETIKKNKGTYLGLNTACLTCHSDYHQKTLSTSCTNCHNLDAFRPAPKFNHNSAKFQLKGKHTRVECVKCHKMTTREGKELQAFTGIQFKSCVNCHTDPHRNQFGQNCSECHTVESFLAVKEMSNFDHSRTSFQLQDKHKYLTCKACHKSNVTEPVKHDRCADCHTDYHENQFTSQAKTIDCADCHNTAGFENSSFTVERHNEGNFNLKGGHLATPCFDCHKKQEKWSFREIGNRCSECHKDIHEPLIDKKYYPGSNCESCHSDAEWGLISFDHSKTRFALEGAHQSQSCRSCHFRENNDHQIFQQFTGLSPGCANCHNDVHNKQFDLSESTDCLRCHNPLNWIIDSFNHNGTAFRLDGKHENVSCEKCHKETTDGQKSFILYKIKDFRCESCHL